VRITRKENSTDYELYTFGLETLDSIVVLDDEPTPLGTRGLFIALPDGQAAYDDTIWNITIPNTKSTSYLANYNAYQAALQARDRAIASAEAQITNFGGVTVAQAQIENAQAAVRSAQARLQNSRITAPIAGIITQFDAKVGEFASPGTALISIISKDMFEVEAQVSETDVGKVALGNKVTMTIDAFLGETFNGSIFYIDPAQTTTEGVVGYKIKIAFDQNDDRMKSGLTVNLDIETRKKDNVLYLPQYAVLQNDEGTFVQILESGVPKNIPITLGLQDQNGNVEIISGVSEGEQVLNIGLKTQ
ncbi:MAG: efflux RND transporter periplasmic adaptor subunit, partial [Candidatus Uhrbacteria bacterium]|nr:efflux RND transporter periplasmic adaptor subunit [Candidatus Uhrbacteria bacterium]